MIALLNNGEYFVLGTESIGDFLFVYAEYIGNIDTNVFKILADSNKMSTKELVEYINKNTYSRDEEIVEIYEVGKKIY